MGEIEMTAVDGTRVMPLLDRMPTFEVPEVDPQPVAVPHRPDAVAFADYLLTTLLRHENGLLHADFLRDNGLWLLRSGSRAVAGPDEVIAGSESLGVFRMVLARFGHHYMGGQLYGGFTEGAFIQGGRTRRFALYMANDQWRGYWLRVYTRAE
jgi:hypothetical protein